MVPMRAGFGGGVPWAGGVGQGPVAGAVGLSPCGRVLLGLSQWVGDVGVAQCLVLLGSPNGSRAGGAGREGPEDNSGLVAVGFAQWQLGYGSRPIGHVVLGWSQLPGAVGNLPMACSHRLRFIPGGCCWVRPMAAGSGACGVRPGAVGHDPHGMSLMAVPGGVAPTVGATQLTTTYQGGEGHSARCMGG